ncbi:MAG: pseudouridine synthase [Erysipelotrichaceae bacterium]|nr:pseudouridine synthase [Erysipelotrichaceae bacterium]
MRLNNYISATGLCSRREADTLIEEKRVKVNGVVAILGMRVNEEDEVLVDDLPIKPKNKFVTLAYYKPAGITCTSEPDVKGNIIDAVNYPERIFPIGRLDKESEGLILLTNDGSIVNQILRSENEHEKEYLVYVHKPIDREFKYLMEEGVEIFNPVKNELTVTQPCKVRIIGEKNFKIILKQGLNRQIRRMCSALGYKVVYLKRIRIMNLTLDNLNKGQYRILSDEEYNDLMKQL